jgi:hypothetical protein
MPDLDTQQQLADAAETLGELRLSGIDRCSLDSQQMKPGQDRSGHELRSVVRPQVRRRPAHTDQLREHLDHSTGPNAAGDVDGDLGRFGEGDDAGCDVYAIAEDLIAPKDCLR